MSEIELPASMRPKLAAIETAINAAFEKIRLGGRMIVEGALDIGRELTAAKAIIVPQQWMRWCVESLPFGDRYARILMKLHADYKALPQSNQARLIESTTSVKSALRILESNRPIATVARNRGSVSGQQVTDSDPKTAVTTKTTPIENLPKKQENESPPESQPPEPDPADDLDARPDPPEPDPWQPVKQEARDVYGNVATALERLKTQVSIARGYPVFHFVGAIEQDMNNIGQTVRLAKPTEVCEQCRPANPAQAKNCRVCHDVGMVPKSINDRAK